VRVCVTRLLTFSPRGFESPRLGILINGYVVDVAKSFIALYDASPPSWFTDLKLLIEGGEIALNLLKRVAGDFERDLKSSNPSISRYVYKPDEIDYYPPITSPEKILCLALNYMSHAREIGGKPPSEPYVFQKPLSSLTGHERPVLIPRSSEKVDHEVELAVIIGRRGKYIERSRAYEYVFGYTVFNDISYRDKQMAEGPERQGPYGLRWLHGKGMDTAAPMGPWIVTKDEIQDPQNLRLSLKVNGETRQDGNTNDMIFKIDRIIEFISDGITLKPGDIIATGTPSGVGLATGRFLKHGDIVEAYIENIGVLRNRIFKEGAI
jgi:2-keto-4-pentenoate hydratase/2-oxohepta-3-ene-1,7-dioic acid hydratase in catechol pathway